MNSLVELSLLYTQYRGLPSSVQQLEKLNPPHPPHTQYGAQLQSQAPQIPAQDELLDTFTINMNMSRIMAHIVSSTRSKEDCWGRLEIKR